MVNNTIPKLLSAWLFLAGANATIASADWTEIAEADLKLMGNYVGEWYEAPDKSYQQINPTLSAQVINVDIGVYDVKFVQNLDRRADPYYQATGALLFEEVISFGKDGWVFEVDERGLHGHGTVYGMVAKFLLKRVELESPTLGQRAPEGAKVLFDGSNFDAWVHPDGRPMTWTLTEEGYMEINPSAAHKNAKPPVGGAIMTKDTFKDVRYHMEFRYPVEPGKSGQGRGNSGLFFQGSDTGIAFEVQILNSYGLGGYWNECGGLYRLVAPKVNAARPPLQWQTYDVEYKAARYKDGELVKRPHITVRHNGVLIHNDQELFHATQHLEANRTNLPPQEPGPIMLQDHSNRIQFRNIWIEEL
ncbi:MAG: DUF1080 domain-containing protein [Verrucomicrobia bacterium]|nr:DUF1080 domain-containing protein [Verrucomicrobiota bacterium]MDA1065898.1 DUF1080 domain-containing protein [Verrucomicrobiota bacterium]